MDLDLIIVVDVGNSGAKLGAVKGDDVAGPMRLPRPDARAVRDVAAPMLQGKEAVIALTGSDPKKIDKLQTDPTGSVTFTKTIPSGAAGASVTFQVVIPSTCAVSDPVQHVF